MAITSTNNDTWIIHILVSSMDLNNTLTSVHSLNRTELFQTNELVPTTEQELLLKQMNQWTNSQLNVDLHSRDHDRMILQSILMISQLSVDLHSRNHDRMILQSILMISQQKFQSKQMTNVDHHNRNLDRMIIQ